MTRRAGVVMAGTLAACLLGASLGAGPAAGDPPELSVTSPANGASYARSPSVAGVASHSGPPIDRIDLTLTDHTDREGSFDCGPAPVLSSIPGEGRSEVSFDRPLPTLACNGEYQLAVRAVTGSSTLPPHGAEETTTTRRFVLAVPPAVPSGLEITTDEGERSVSLHWNGNAERDLLGYLIERAHDGNEFEVVGQTVEPSFSDRDFPKGGSYEYRVIAVRYVRNTADGPEVVESNASAPATATMSAPPATSTTVAGGDGGAQTSDPDTTDDRLTALRQRAASRPAPRPRTATTVDTGFQDELPFDAPPPPEAEDEPAVETDLDGSVIAEFDDPSRDSREVLLPIAGGLVLLMGALQLRYLAHRAAQPASVPALDPAAGPVPPAVGPEPRRRRAEPLRARRADR